MQQISGFALALAAGLVTVPAGALTFDQNVTNNVIFGSGNANGGFTVDRANGIELGLRGKLRFDENNQPQNTFNSDGAGTYTFPAINPPTGFGFDPNSPTTPVWNFEWSINSSFDSDGPGAALNAFTYLLQIDGDPTAGTDFGGSGGFDPINLPFADHALGTNATGPGGGTTAADATGYAALIGANNLAQNSWSYEFFNENTDGLFLDQLAAFDPLIAGLYTIRLSAFDGQALLAQTEITIRTQPVPLPAALPMLLGALGVLGWAGRRRREPAA